MSLIYDTLTVYATQHSIQVGTIHIRHRALPIEYDAVAVYLISVPWIQVWASGYGRLHIFLYRNHTRRLCLEKLLYRSSSGHFKPLLDPGGGFTSEASEAAVKLLYSGLHL